MKKENKFYTEERERNHDLRIQNTILLQEHDAQYEEIEKMSRVFTRIKSGDATVRLSTIHSQYVDLYIIANSVVAKQEKLLRDSEEYEHVKHLCAQIAEQIHHQSMMNQELSLMKTGTCLDIIVTVLNRDQKTQNLFTL